MNQENRCNISSFGHPKKQHFLPQIPGQVMEQSQLVELIRTISPEERQDILSFANLGFANHGKMRAFVAPLLEICMDHFWENPQGTLEKKEVYALLFQGQPFVEGKLEKTMVDALKVLRLYLSARHYCREENQFQQWYDFAEIIRLKGLNARFQQVVDKLRKSQSEVKQKNIDFYLKNYLLEYAIHYQQAMYNQLSGDLNLVRTLEALEKHYYSAYLALVNRFVFQSKISRLDVPPIIEDSLRGFHLPERSYTSSAFIAVNYEVYLLLKKNTPTVADARQLLDLLIQFEDELDQVSLRAFYACLRNVCVIALLSNFHNEDMALMLLWLYKDNLDRGFLHFEGKLHSMTYLAVANHSFWVKDLDWAAHFIEKYKDEVYDDNENRDYHRLVKATYLFHVGKFDECLDLIPDSSSSIHYLLQGKRLTLKAYYELQSDLLSFKLDNFKMFLARTSPKILSETARQSHIDFANILTQIYKSIPGDAKRAELIVKRIKERPQIAEWQWLIEKAQALKGK